MESELTIVPLHIRRSYLAYKYCLKCLTWTNNKTVEFLEVLELSSRCRYWLRKKSPLLATVYSDVKHERIFTSNPLKMFSLDTWVSNIRFRDVIRTNLDLVQCAKKLYHPSDIRNNVLLELSEKYGDWHKVYTDASKTETSIGAAYFDPVFKTKSCYNIISEICIMSAELFAISEAISYAISLKCRNIVIFTDSKSALQHVARCASGNRGTAIAYTVLDKLYTLPTDMSLRLQWIPAHIGLSGNEEVDILAKEACTIGSEVYITPDFTEKLHTYNKKIRGIWKVHFDERCKEKGIWYRTMQCEPPHIPWFMNARLSRKLIKIGLRLRSGHIPLKKFAFMMKKVPSPNCEACNVVEDVQHVLVECVRNEGNRQLLMKSLNLNRLDVGVFQSILAAPISEEAKEIYLFVYNYISQYTVRP
ncbi:uncharacterized protein LOC134680480 [Cydia fagiglandana]